WNQLTGNRVDYAPSQQAAERFPQIPRVNFGQAVQLVMPEGEVISGARAVFMTLTFVPRMAWLLWLYNHFPVFASVSEAAYGGIAAHRTFFYQLTRVTFGRRIISLHYARVEWIFLRILAAIYLVAFISFG